MNRFNLNFWFITLCMLFVSLNLSAQSKLDLAKYNCNSAPVSYTDDEGLKKEGILLFVNHRDAEEQQLQLTSVYLLKSDGYNMRIGTECDAFFSTYDAKVSPDSKYLALYHVGEGHPWIEVYDLQKMISEGISDLVAEVNPYPGNIALIGWQDAKLLIECDIDMMKKNNDGTLSDSDFLEKNRKYLFDIKQKIYSASK